MIRLADLREEISIELEAMAADAAEAGLLLREFACADVVPLRVTAAGTALLVDFYGALEAILQQLHCYHGVVPPDGPDWRRKLLGCFMEPACPPFPCLFTGPLLLELSALRVFRQAFCCNYGFRPGWTSVREGLERLPQLCQKVTESLGAYISRLH